jgi:methylmalonyl-CoA mutase
MSAPVPSLESFVEQVEQGLGGRSYASLSWQTLDGFALAPVQTRADLAGLPHLGATALLRVRRGFAIRELVLCPAPEAANARARRALARGADEVEFALDTTAQDALEPGPEGEADADELLGDRLPGDGGVALHCRADLDAVLDRIDLERTSIWFSAGEGGLPVLAWWLRRADALGVPREQLRGGLDLDPIARLTTRRLGFVGEDAVGARRAAIAPVFGEAAAAVRVCRQHCPGVRPLVVDGQGFHLAGASPAVEVGMSLAAAVDVARRLGRHGIGFADFAAAVTLRVQVGHELLAEVAKLRALRLLWAKVAAGFGAAGEARIPRLLTVGSGRFRAGQHDQRTNLVRSALAGFAAVVGGTDAAIVLPWNEATDDEAAADLARDQLHLLRDEARLDRVADPLGGSFAVERLTHEIGAAAWDLLRQIEAGGGFVEAARNGALAARLEAAESAREQAFRCRRRVLVGISRFADPELGGPAEAEAGDDPGPALLARHEAWRADRDAEPAAALCARIAGLAPERFFDEALADAADHASLAELATATWPPEGVVFEHRLAPVASTDGGGFEELRDRAELAAEDGAAPRVALLPFGPERSARARVDFARDLFQVGGFRVSELQAVADLAAAVPAGTEVLVLCSDDASYPAAVDALRAGLGDRCPRLIVAGRADEALRARVDGVVQVGIDAVQFLDGLQAALGLGD